MRQEILASVFLILLAVPPILVVVGACWRRHFTVPQAILLTGAVLLTRLLWRAGRPPRLNVGETRGAVIVSNHRSSIDPFFVQVCHDRPIHWLVAREYCEHPLFAWFLTTCAVIPVNRGGIDTAATKAAIRCVREGGVVGMFPEGRINMSDKFMLPVRAGAILVAIKANAPLVPCYIEGSPYDRVPWSPFLMTARVKVRFGTPIEPLQPAANDSESDLTASLITEVVRRIAALAGQPCFVPRLAGRKWKPTARELAEAMSESGRRGESHDS